MITLILTLLCVLLIGGLTAGYYYWRIGSQHVITSEQLPDVSLYGGESDLLNPSLIASEYPRGVEVNTKHLEQFAQQQPIYQICSTLLSPAEQAYFARLRQALKSQPYEVLARCALKDILILNDALPAELQQIAQQRLQEQMVDFLIVDVAFQPLVAVLLQAADVPVKQSLQQRFVDEILRRTGMQVMTFDAQEWQTVNQIRHAFNQHCGWQLPITPNCPRCQHAMRKTTITKGRHAGKQVWVCETYPRCKTVLPAA